MKATKKEQDSLAFDTAPNRLTLLRMIAVPGVVYCLSLETFSGDIAACVVFGLAAITDWFDGYLARAYQTETIFGKLMDPLADKFLVVGSLIMLQQLERIHPYLVMILIFRELGITSLRALASAEGVIISAGTGGKWKAALQMVAIPFLILNETLWGFLPCALIGKVLISVSIVLSLTSASTYAWDFFRELRSKLKAKRNSP
jgi:CDP-diacylglycerol---glycerol-3-phosphate 3-phosphatidyltransferase